MTPLTRSGQVDYSGTSDSDSESDKVPSAGPGSQLEQNRAFQVWRMIPASFMQVSDARTCIAGIDVDRRL
jgi:hypothetical protein